MARTSGGNMPEQTTSSTPEHVHETFDADIRPIVITTAVLFIGTAILFLALFFVLILLKNRSAATDSKPNPVQLAVPPPPEPQLQPSPPHPNLDSQDLVEMRRAEDQRLKHYSRDPKTGEVHIPITRAMELLLQQQAKQPPTAVGVAR
jgi:hypothetical protein